LHTASPWTIIEPLRAWQGDALARWRERDHRGVIEAATGTGKTYVALAAVEGFVAEFGDRGRVVVVVSSLAMARQWKTDLIVKLGVPEGEIAEWHSEAAPSALPASPRLILAVIDTARRRLPNLMQSWHDAGLETLLVVDECHHAASPTNRRIFDVRARRSLGLSATVERDDGDEQVVYDGAGEICYTYSLLDALEDGVLAPITSVNLYVEFTAAERDDWLALGTTVETLWAQLQRHQLAVGGVDTRLNLNETDEERIEPGAVRGGDKRVGRADAGGVHGARVPRDNRRGPTLRRGVPTCRHQRRVGALRPGCRGTSSCSLIVQVRRLSSVGCGPRRRRRDRRS
jgi:hypothetical protein